MSARAARVGAAPPVMQPAPATASSTRLSRTMDRCADVRSQTYVPSIKPLEFHRDTNARPRATCLILGLYEDHDISGAPQGVERWPPARSV